MRVGECPTGASFTYTYVALWRTSNGSIDLYPYEGTNFRGDLDLLEPNDEPWGLIGM